MEVSELETLTEELRGLVFGHLSAKLGRSLTRSGTEPPPRVASSRYRGRRGSYWQQLCEYGRRGFAAVIGVSVDGARALLGVDAQECTRD